jgi:hypothetical protein
MGAFFYFKIFDCLINLKGLFICFSLPPFWLNAKGGVFLRGMFRRRKVDKRHMLIRRMGGGCSRRAKHSLMLRG